MRFGVRILNNLQELLFPKRADAIRIEELTPADMHLHYDPLMSDALAATASYKDPVIRACVHEIKFHNNERGAELLGMLLARFAREHIEEACLVVPIPLSGKRYRERGYNQVVRIAARACDVSPQLTLMPHALRRTHHTVPQTSLKRKADRLANMRGAFALRLGAAKKIRGAHIILLDDVLTTGATMRAGEAALLPHRPASVMCVALAH